MGLLTPILFSNDDCHVMRENPEETIKVILQAMMHPTKEDYCLVDVVKPKWYEFWKKPKIRGHYIDAIQSLSNTHSSDSRLIFLSGGAWEDLNTIDFDNISYIGLDIVERDLKKAQKILTEAKKKAKQRRDIIDGKRK